MNPFNEPESPSNQDTPSVFDGLGISEESVSRFLAERDRHDTSKQVCICGHAINKHSGYEEGIGNCVTGRHWCPCKAKNPVLYANDTRYFMRKTYGSGSRHALSTGLQKLGQVGKRAYWLEPPACWNDKCTSGNPLIFPVSMDSNNRIIKEPGPVNVFLCESCILTVLGVPGNEGKGWVW